VEDEIWRAGQEATFRTGITGLHPEMVKMMGRLKYRTSYGQNVLAHSIEVSVLAGIIAAELGINPKNAKRGGLLHDIGKAADAEQEGSHPEVGGRYGRKYGEHAVVVNCIEAHHGDIDRRLKPLSFRLPTQSARSGLARAARPSSPTCRGCRSLSNWRASSLVCGRHTR
jgi:ribonuclease Y